MPHAAAKKMRIYCIIKVYLFKFCIPLGTKADQFTGCSLSLHSRESGLPKKFEVLGETT